MMNSEKRIDSTLFKLLLILFSSIFFLIIFIIYFTYSDQIEKAANQSKDLSLTLDQYIYGSFNRAELVIEKTRRDIERDEHFYELSTTEKSKKLNTFLKDLKEIEILAITDENGFYLANTYWLGDLAKIDLHKNSNISDRTYFKSLKESTNDDLIISEPLVAKTTGNLIIVIAKKLVTNTNKFKGVILVSINLKTISDFFSILKPSIRSSIALYGLDRKLLARSPFQPEAIGKVVPIEDSDAATKFTQDFTQWTYKTMCPFDNEERIFSFKKTEKLPVSIFVGISTKDVVYSILPISIFLFIIFLVLGLIVYKGIKRYLRKVALIQSQQLQLIQSDKLSSIGTISSGIAHEIKNPLSIVLARSEQIYREIESLPEQNEKLLKIVSNLILNAQRINKIINSMKSISRDSSNDPMEKVLLQSIIESTTTLMSDKIKSSGVDFKIMNIPDIHIFCRESQIEQVLINLINNSIDAINSKTEKWIKVNFEIIDYKIKILILDSGNGISKKIKDKIMKPFFTTKPVGQGTGLGLSISKNIIEEHNGSFYIDENSQNTCFIIELNIYKGG